MSSNKFDASQSKVSLLKIKGSTFRNGQMLENDHIFLIIDRRISPILSENLLNATDQPHIRLSVARKMNSFFRNLLVFLIIWLQLISFHRAYKIDDSLQRCTNDNKSCIQTIKISAAGRSSSRAMTQSTAAIRNKLKAHNVSRYNWLH